MKDKNKYPEYFSSDFHVLKGRENYPRLDKWGNRIYITPEQQRTQPLRNRHPHYTDDRFKHGQLIWGSEDVQSWDYDDRIHQWDYEKHEQAWAKAGKDHKVGSANFYEKYLQLFWDDPNLKLIGIVAGYNWSNGYPYQAFGYKRGETK